MKSIREGWPYPILVLVLGLAAAAPLWLISGLPNSDDSLTHVFNLFTLDQQIQAGNWWPLRFPERGLGYGYAVLAYYPPLPYALLALLHLGGMDYVLSFKLALTFMTILAGFSSFWLGQQLFDRRAGLLVALLYLFSPYFQANLHLRGALAEQLGLAIGPLLLLAIGRSIQTPGWRNSLLSSLVIALLVLAHFVSTLLYLPFALLYALWLLARAPRGERWLRSGWLLLAGLTGALLTSFYWLPALVESGGLRRFEPTAARTAYLAEMLPVVDLFRPSAVITYRNTHQMPEMGLPLLLLLGAALLLYFTRRSSIALTGWAQGRFWGVVGVFTLLLATAWAAPLWQMLPAIAILQFPFRWLGPAALFCAIASGGVMVALPVQRTRRWWLGLGGVTLLLLWYGYAAVVNLPRQAAQLRSAGVAQVTAQEITLAGLYAYEYDQADNWRDACWFWAYEYIPATSSLSDCAAMRDLILQSRPLTANLPPVAAQIQPQWVNGYETAVHSSSTQPWLLALHAFWIPGWRAEIDGLPVATRPVGAMGMVGVQVPAGEHEVKLSYGPTPLRRALFWASALAGVCWLLAGLCYHPVLAAQLLLGVVSLTGFLYLRTPQPLPSPVLQAVDYGFGQEITLEGYGVAVTGEQLRLNLVWLARQSMRESYKVFVHVIDDTGRLWAQDDSRPLRFASNTNRWLPGQVIFDEHALPLPPDLPAGEYQVRVGLYNEQNGQRLPVVDERGETVDDQVLLQQVTVTEIGK